MAHSISVLFEEMVRLTLLEERPDWYVIAAMSFMCFPGFTYSSSKSDPIVQKEGESGIGWSGVWWETLIGKGKKTLACWSGGFLLGCVSYIFVLGW